MKNHLCRVCGEEIYNFVSKSEKDLCPHCYINELFKKLWTKDRRQANHFASTFSFLLGQSEMGFENNGKERAEFGVCDRCGEPSNGLRFLEGEWVCESCWE